ncbi:mucin-2-like [Haplochromis burtoni]|uniref:mucin-2-like n=1 Tax=Haplochromis burtoni TaxID=8153 RepID=UPI001C2CD989|nr:mucin-2-like [Haplochromis burtoni]
MEWKVVWLCFLACSVSIVIDIQAESVYKRTCSTWGREHFKTFDGDVYQFPGMCEYKLVKTCDESQNSQTFSMDIKRKENPGNSTIRFVVVKINSYLYNISKDLVTLDEQSIQLPYFQAGVRLEKTEFYLKLYSQVGITVMWYNDDAVMVEIDDEYANRICGLCGDFNGNSDLRNKDTGQQISPITFGNGWKTASPINCEDLTEAVQTSGKTENMTDSCKEFEIFCKDLFKNESWSSCIPLIHPEPYIQACVKDMCHCSNLNGSCVCSTLSEFSRQCSHAGGQPPNWRTPKLCAKHCPPTMVYDEYGSPCINTCRFPDTSLVCEDHNIDGCFCPPETVLDDISTGSCIPLSECPCKHDKVYKSNEVYQERGENCTCIAGKWSCESLQMHATCSVEQGSYITTFDGKDFTFHGDCDYTLAKVNSKDYVSPNFTILVHLTQCSRQQYDSCLKTLKIHLNRDKNNAIIFTSEGRVQKNGRKVTLPYNSGDISIFHASSFHIMLQTSFGLQIQIQHVPLMQVYVSLEQSYREKTRGLCGNYNMMQSDDMRTRQGMVEGEEGTFSNSWKTDYSCKDGHGRLDDPCSLRTENEKFAKNWCPLLRQPNSTFARCHSVVDAETYYKRCIYASCNCEKSEDCLCAVFSSFARACASKGVFLIGWRKDVCNKRTKNCPASQTFSYKNQRCQLTCRSLSSKMQSCTSDFLPVGGCSCAENHYLDDNDICVPKAKCPCYHNDETIEPGKTININNDYCVCTDGVLHCDPLAAGSSTCTSPKEYFNCSTADKRDVGVQCARTCSNPDNECDATECKSGCLCPRGLVDDGKGSCVKENQCPCQHGNKLYSSGEKISKKCNTCTCKSGKWDCTDKKCPGTCIIYGSGHYITFDENSYGFHGQMSYTVVKNTCGNKTQENNFTVIIESEICELPNPICFRKIRIHLGEKEITLLKGDVISPNGTEIQYTKRKLGFYLVVEFDIGLTVISDHKATVKIRLEPQYSVSDSLKMNYSMYVM